MEFTKTKGLKGEITVPGDKSVSHRAVMFGSLAEGLTEVTNFLQGADCLSTISCFQKMGIKIENTSERILVHGKGLRGLHEPASILDVGNSGTTARLISGILAPQKFTSMLTGDDSIQTRPMNRVMDPLSEMGAHITSEKHNGCAPLKIEGRSLHSIHYQSKVASAQVKSAILLAGLYAEGKTSVTEPQLSRNHTELMLKHFGANIESRDTTASITECSQLYGQKITVPGDISSAAYFIAAGLILPNSEILIKNVGINQTRAGLIEVCRKMGGNIELLNRNDKSGEPTADIFVSTSQLHGITIEGSIIPTLIDELPIIAVMACFAEGTTTIKDAAELKVKESNRIDVMTRNLTAMNADITPTDDGMVITGGSPLKGAEVNSHHDHRIAMSFAIAGLAAHGTTKILGSDCVNISYPGFYQTLATLNTTT